MDIFSIAWWGMIGGGLGLFLVGITMLGEGLKKLAGNKLKYLIDKYTSNPFKGILIGFGFTAIIQSSSATTTIVISLVKAGLMNLPQAIGVIMGANIGTTVTAFLISLHVDTMAPFILVIGSFIFLLANRPSWRHFGEVLIGFGGLFFGLKLMENPLKELATLPEFRSLIAEMNIHPLEGLLLGTIGTAAVQSSSAFIGVLQNVYAAANETTFPLHAALPILFGANIGTTITAFLAAIGGSVTSRRASAVHTLFNVFGSLVFLILLNPYTAFLEWLSVLWGLDAKTQIAIAHIVFNIVTTLLLFPLINVLQKVVSILVPGQETTSFMTVDVSELEKDILKMDASTALDIAFRKTVVLGDMALGAAQSFRVYLTTFADTDRDTILNYEKSIDQVYEKLIDYLNAMRQTVLEANDVLLYGHILRTIKDIERIGDHCENLIQYFDEANNRNERLNGQGLNDVQQMMDYAISLIRQSLQSFATKNLELAKKVKLEDKELDHLDKQNRGRHLQRFFEGVADKNHYLAMVFIDIIANIERLGDHAVNIADTVVEQFGKNPNFAKHDALD